MAKRTLVALLVTMTPACVPKRQPDQPAASERSIASDDTLVDRMEKMRARALNTPGGAMEASDFAFHLSLLFTQGVTARRTISQELVDEAVGALDRAREQKPDNAPDLLARKGELLIAAGRVGPGEGALRLSLSERPNLRAFNALAKHYVSQSRGTDLEPFCKRALPAMKSDESRYAVLDECLKSSGAATPEAGLRWASPKDLAFYKSRRKELEARLAKQQRAKEEAKDASKETVKDTKDPQKR